MPLLPDGRPAAAGPARVAVVIVTHADYTQRYLEPCYRSLQCQTYPAADFEVFLVSNGVSESARDLVARMAPEARTVEHPSNLGWPGGSNSAIRIALAEGFQYVVTLNPDTVLEDTWLEALVSAADAQPEVHIFQSKILLHGTDTIQSLGNRLHYLGYAYCNGYGVDRSAPPSRYPMDFASGAAMLVKREVFEAIGLFRSDYFIYYDDTEFCWRARLAGFNLGFVEGSVCYHKYHFQSRLSRLYYFQRNRLLNLLTLQRLRTIALTAPCLIVSELVLAGYFIGRGWGKTVWELVRYFLRPDTWVAIRARRREIGRLRKRPDAAIVKRFAGTIVFPEIESPVMRYVVNPLLGLYWAVTKPFLVW
jgi:GT2 family glycosyltransferase